MTEPTFALAGQSIAGRDKRTIRPISADETFREYGRAGRRFPAPFLWSLVRPASKTAGIVVGGKIRTWRGVGTVTRVGTIAGFYMLDGREQRWEIESVREIIIEQVSA